MDAERQGQNAYGLLSSVAQKIGQEEIAISVITLTELAHGVVRARTVELRSKRQTFLDELLSAVPVHPISAKIAIRAGAIDGEAQASGIRIPFSDLLIGTTALSLGYRVGTANLRYFQLIPGLKVLQL